MFVWLGEAGRMANITISSLDDGRWTRLRDRAAGHGRSVDEEACLLIYRVVGSSPRRGSTSVVLS